MAKISIYLNFPGNTEEAFDFYKSILGGEYLTVQRFKDTPNAATMPESEHEKLMHIALSFGENVLMGTDALESQGHHLTAGNNFNITLWADSEEEAERFFNGLSEGGTVILPMEKTFWNAYFGMCIDKFDINWMISYDYKQ